MLDLAYLDPGSGSILLQALLGGLAGIGVVIRLFGAKTRRALTSGRKRTVRPELNGPDVPQESPLGDLSPQKGVEGNQTDRPGSR